MATPAPLSWRAKRRFWTRWQVFRHKVGKPATIGPPEDNEGRIEVAPFEEVYPQIPMRDVRVVVGLPKQEDRLGMRVLVGLGLFLTRVLSPMRRDLPEIDSDTATALGDAGISTYAKAFKAPVRPAAFAHVGTPDLGDLAVRGPYALFTERDDEGRLRWDFDALGDFAHQDGLCSLGVRVLFSQPSGSTGLTATRIESRELGDVEPGDADWDRAVQLAVCAATTHASLTRHFNYVHLISGNHWDVATRNRLPSDHPLYRLLWPHIFNSFYTNYGVTRVQMQPDGDFVNMFSLTHDGLIAYFDEMYRSYDITVIDPVADWSRRGLGEETFDSPGQQNLVELFDVMHAHASRYVDAYYESDDALRADQAVRAWLDELGALVPNGLGAVDGDVTRADLSRLIAGYIHEGAVIHDLVGTTLWDYQLWADCNPVRMYRDGRRVPVDVYQRMINNNFALQLRRAPLLGDYGNVALDDGGAALFTRFRDECRALQARYGGSAAGPWRMEPENLEINMNG